MKRRKLAALGLAVMMMCTACGNENNLQKADSEQTGVQDTTSEDNNGSKENTQKDVMQDTAVSGDVTEETTQEQQSTDNQLTQDDIDNYIETTQKESWKVIQEYGFENGYSTLSFYVDGMTLYDGGDYYSISAMLGKPVKAPGNLKTGDSCELETDGLAGMTTAFTYNGDGILTDADGREYHYEPTSDGSEVVLYGMDDSQLICWFYNGELYINKDAVTGSGSAETTFTKDEVGDEGKNYNKVAFDKNGMVTKLISE